MLKLRLEMHDERTVIVLGLVPTEIARLAIEPIAVELDELDMPGVTVWLALGETEQTLAAELQQVGVPLPDSGVEYASENPGQVVTARNPLHPPRGDDQSPWQRVIRRLRGTG